MTEKAMKNTNKILHVDFGNHGHQSEHSIIEKEVQAKTPFEESRSRHASKKTKGSVQPLRTQEEIDKVANYLLSKGKYALRNWMIFIFGICTGLRCSDILSRTFKDVVDEYGNIRNEFTVIEQKTNKVRRIEINDRLYLALRQYVDTFNGRYNPEGLLFTSNKKSSPQLRVDTVREILAEACERAINDERKKENEKIAANGGKDKNGNVIRPKPLVHAGSHSMRKTFAYHAFKAVEASKNDINLYGHTALTYVQASLNHASARDTTRYLDLNRELDVEVNRILSKRFDFTMPPPAVLAAHAARYQ